MTIEVPPPAGRGKVPVWRTAMDSYGFVFGNLDRFFALGWLPLVIAFAVNMAIDVLADVGGGKNGFVADWVTYTALEAANWAMYLVFAVRWHRFFLLDEHESVFSGIFAARNWRFLGYTLLLTFAPFVPVLVFLFISGFVSSLFSTPSLILFFVMIRFSLVLPGTAVDRPIGLGEAWRGLGGNTWRYIGAIIPVAIPMIIAGFILNLLVPIWFASMDGGGPGSLMTFLVVRNLVNIILTFFVIAFGITVLSKTYRHIIGDEWGEGSAAGVSA